MDKEREERNYYMLEREKMFQMWNLLMEQIQLEKEKAALFDAHLQDVCHCMYIKWYIFNYIISLPSFIINRSRK